MRAAWLALLVLALLGLGPAQFGPQADDDGLAALLAAGAICSGAAGHDAGSDQNKAPAGHAHAHCVLCQAGMAPFMLAAGAAVPAPATAMRLPRLAGVWHVAAPDFAKAYASRAPPVIG